MFLFFIIKLFLLLILSFLYFYEKDRNIRLQTFIILFIKALHTIVKIKNKTRENELLFAFFLYKKVFIVFKVMKVQS